MFGKLLKHQLKNRLMNFLTAYIIVIGLFLLIELTVLKDIPIINNILNLLIPGIAFYTLYDIGSSLNAQMYGNSGYLLFSTPANTHSIVLSKIFTNTIWFITTILTVLSLFIIRDINNETSEESIIQYFQDVEQFYLMVIFILLIIFSFNIILCFIFTFLNTIYNGRFKAIGFILVIAVFISLVFGYVYIFVEVIDLTSLLGDMFTNIFVIVSLLLGVFLTYFSTIKMIEKRLEL